MTRVLLLAMLFLMVKVATGQSFRTQTIGPCLILNVRGNQTSGPAVDECKGNRSSWRAGDHYEWVIPQLAYAFDQVERAQCDHLGCLGALPVTVFIIPNGLPNAAVRRDADQLTLYFDTGLIDFIDGTARSFQADLNNILQNKPVRAGFADWMTSMVRSGGQSCNYRVEFPTPTVAATDLPQEQALASAIYQLVLGHELSHYLTPDYRCLRARGNSLALEMSCDQIAEHKLLRTASTTFFPTPVVAWFMAMDNYYRLTDPLYHDLFAAPNAPPTFEAMFPATDFRSRANQLTNEWRSFCDSGATSALCPTGYSEAIDFSSQMEDKPAPTACSRGGTMNSGGVARTGPSLESASLAGKIGNEPADTPSLCNDLAVYTASAANGFQSIKGPLTNSDSDGKTYDLKRGVQGYGKCHLTVDSDSSISPSAICYANAGSDLAALWSDVKACFPSQTARHRQTSGGEEYSIKLANGVGVRVRSSPAIKLWVDAPDKPN